MINGSWSYESDGGGGGGGEVVGEGVRGGGGGGWGLSQRPRASENAGREQREADGMLVCVSVWSYSLQ